MATRLELHELLCDILESKNVYYQPPENVNMKYPAIRYYLDDIDNKFADNMPYHQKKSYQIIVIDKNPDSVIADKIAKLPYCSFNRFYTSDNLNHFSFTLYF